MRLSTELVVQGAYLFGWELHSTCFKQTVSVHVKKERRKERLETFWIQTQALFFANKDIPCPRHCDALCPKTMSHFFFFFCVVNCWKQESKTWPCRSSASFPPTPPFIIRIISHLKSKRDQKEVRQIKRVEKEIGAREKAKVKMLLGQLTSGQKNAPGSSLLFQLRTHSADVSFKRINSFFYLVVAYGSVFVETFLYSLV